VVQKGFLDFRGRALSLLIPPRLCCILSMDSISQEMTDMKTITLGQTGIEVTQMCVGTLTLGRLQANVPAEQGAAAIRRAIDLGANFVDTAQAYATYPHVAHAIRGVEKDLVIASKSKAANYEEMEKAIYECRKALRREVVDIFYLHMIADEKDLNSRSWALKCIMDFKEAGAVRAVAASTHTNAGLQAIADCPEIQVIMPCINRKGLGITDGTIDECLQIARVCRERGKSIVAMKPLGGGHLRADAAAAINWVRALPEVDCLAVGMLTPQEAEMNVRIFNDEPVPPDVAAAVSTQPKQLIIYDTCEGCGRCVARCHQHALEQKKGRTPQKPVVDQAKCILCGYCADACPHFSIRII